MINIDKRYGHFMKLAETGCIEEEQFEQFYVLELLENMGDAIKRERSSQWLL